MKQTELFHRIGIIALFAFKTSVYAADTFTDPSCNAVTATMTSCARRWDSIRQDCTNSYGNNSVWPGPCECSYYANDMPCFDEQALCAHQIWTQAPQWFRDGVTSCLMKDASYTIRAELGSIENPFLITGIAGNTTSTPTNSAQTGSFPNTLGPTSPPQTAPVPDSVGLQNGAKIGIGVGIGVGVPILIIILAFVIARRRPHKASDPAEELAGTEKYEVHENDAKIYEAGFNVSKTELPGAMGVELQGENGVELAGEWGHEMAGDHGRQACGTSTRHELEAPPGVSELSTRKL